MDMSKGETLKTVRELNLACSANLPELNPLVMWAQLNGRDVYFIVKGDKTGTDMLVLLIIVQASR